MKKLKPIDIIVLASSLFVLYLIFGDLLWYFGLVSLPLAAPVSGVVTLLAAADVVLVNLYILHRRGQAKLPK